MKAHVAVGLIQCFAQPIGLALMAMGYPVAGGLVEAVGGGASFGVAYLTREGE